MTDLRSASSMWSARGAAIDMSSLACWRRLGQQRRGRVALSEHDFPGIYPVDYLLEGAVIVFRTADEERLRPLHRDERVAFEASGDFELGIWSVMLTGTAREVRSRRAPAADPAETFTYVRIQPTGIRGRVWTSVID